MASIFRFEWAEQQTSVKAGGQAMTGKQWERKDNSMYMNKMKDIIFGINYFPIEDKARKQIFEDLLEKLIN
jgi:hypothetical protein